MRVTPTGRSEYHEGNEVGRYGQDISANQQYFCWYHDGLRSFEEPAWAMDKDVEAKIGIQVDTILVADAHNGLYAVERDAFRDHTITLDGREQFVARASDGFVTRLTGDHGDILGGHLWIPSGNKVDEGYHKKQNH